MSAQQQIFATDDFGILPSALVVLMTILAMLGVIANARGRLGDPRPHHSPAPAGRPSRPGPPSVRVIATNRKARRSGGAGPRVCGSRRGQPARTAAAVMLGRPTIEW